MAHFLDRVLGDPNKKTLKRLQSQVERINALESDLEKLDDKKIRARSLYLLKKVQSELKYPQDKLEWPEPTRELQKKEQAILEPHIPEAFALVREAAKRTLGQRHFDVQLLAGLVLHEGNIAEQKTGEGKTLSATLPAYLNALVGRGVHIITVNDYLAKRDAGWMGQVFDFLGLSVACIAHDTSYLFSKTALKEKNADEPPANEDPGDENNPVLNLKLCDRQEAYRADITYGTNNEYGFDYLRDNMAPAPKYLRQRPLYYSIVDEVDSILIDEARTPLIISAPAEESGDLYTQFAQLVPRLPAEDYEIDEKERAVRLLESGIQKMQGWLKVNSLYENENILLVHHLDEALKAHLLFERDKDYVVREGEVVIVDPFTGRLMPGRRYSEGLHQAIEAKEGVHVQRESDTLATISFQNFFRLYAKLSGMTGTAKTEEEEFLKLYGMEVVVVPTHHPMIRRDQADKIYVSEEAKFKAIIEEVKERRKRKQPLLIGTISVAKNEYLSGLLHKAGVPHEVLNAKNHEQEASVIANAGAPGAVTLATNMAGRGTDIMLGGAAPEKEDKAEYETWQANRQTTLEAGGLLVIGSERHESRRIDNQLRGRSGRQGEPGESIFYVSLDDDLMRIFGGERMKGWIQKVNAPEDVPVQSSIVSRSIEQAQKRVEGHNFDIRKHVVQYDDVMNKHRESIYAKRRRIMTALGIEGNDPKSPHAPILRETVLKTINQLINGLIKRYLKGEKIDWEIDQLVEEVAKLAPLTTAEQKTLVEAVKKEEQPVKVAKMVESGLIRRYEEKEKQHGENEQRLLERAVMLRTIDSLWVEHLNLMQDLRQGVGLQAIAQHDPLVVYQNRGYEQFQLLLSSIDYEAARQLLHLTRAQAEIAPKAPDKNLILQGASEADAGGATGIQNINQSAEQQAQLQAAAVNSATRGASNSDVSVTIRRVSEKLQAAGQESGQSVSHKKVGRNDPCPCGSGKKYKRCHGQ